MKSITRTGIAVVCMATPNLVEATDSSEFYRSCYRDKCFVGRVLTKQRRGEGFVVETAIKGPRYFKTGKYLISCATDGEAADLMNLEGTSGRIKPRSELPDRFSMDAYNVWWLVCEGQPDKFRY